MTQPAREYGAIIVEVVASMRSPQRYFVEETVADCAHKKRTGWLRNAVGKDLIWNGWCRVMGSEEVKHIFHFENA